MIRVVVVVMGLILGFGFAVLTQGKVAHLRFLANDALPEWVETLSPDSGFVQGSAMQVAPNINAEWQLTGVTLDGLVYQLRFIGEAVAIRANVKVAWGGQGARFWQARGQADLDKIYLPEKRIALTGILYLEGLKGSVDYNSQRIRSLSGEVILREVLFGGNNLGDLKISLSHGEPDVWLAQLRMPKGALILSADARGQFDKSVAQIDGVISEGEDMPDSWRRNLDQILPKTTEGWQVNQSLDLSNPVIEQ